MDHYELLLSIYAVSIFPDALSVVLSIDSGYSLSTSLLSVFTALRTNCVLLSTLAFSLAFPTAF